MVRDVVQASLECAGLRSRLMACLAGVECSALLAIALFFPNKQVPPLPNPGSSIHSYDQGRVTCDCVPPV